MHVRMIRQPGQFPAPHVADVHPDEVANYRAGGWSVDDHQPDAGDDEAAPLPKRRGRPPKAA